MDRPRTAALLFTLLAIVMLAGAFRDFGNLGAKDWESILGQAQAELTSVRDYGQLPLWNPWRAGGQPSLAQPGSLFLSPVTPLVFLVGVLPAFKLLLVVLFVVGCLGLWALAGYLGLSGPARLVPAVVFFGSSAYPLCVSGGLPHWLFAMALLPWLFLFHRRAMDGARFILPAGLVYAGLVFWGGLDRAVQVPLLLGIDALCVAFSRRSAMPLLALAAVLALGVSLAAVRVAPIAEIYLAYPREMEAATSFVPPGLLPRLLLSTELPDLASLGGSFIQAGDGNLVNWINAGSYVGPVALVLAAAGALLRARSTWVFSLLAVVVLWLCFGTGVEPSLWWLLNQLPVFGSMRGPERLMALFVFFLALLAGYGFDAFGKLLDSRWRGGDAGKRMLEGAALLALTLPLLWVNAPISATAFIVDPPTGPGSGGWFERRAPRPPFRQTLHQVHEHRWRGILFEPVLRNEGNLLGHSNIPNPRAAHPDGHPRYRGEVYLKKGRGSVSAEITPNVIRVTADVDEPDRLVVNQNFFPGWRADGTSSAPLLPFHGLLSLDLDPGHHELTLSYRPASVMIGAGISTATAVACVLFAVLASRRRRAQPPLPGV